MVVETISDANDYKTKKTAKWLAHLWYHTIRPAIFIVNRHISYPLIPSMAIPSTRYLCNMMKKIMTGSSEITDITNNPP